MEGVQATRIPRCTSSFTASLGRIVCEFASESHLTNCVV
jgi:hypothetical protein